VAPERPIVNGNVAAQPATSTRAGPAHPTLKFGTYDGRTPLETFLAKFENCSGYYDWDARERLCHLHASLEGDAGQVLWDAGTASSVDDRSRCYGIVSVASTKPRGHCVEGVAIPCRSSTRRFVA